MERLLQSGTVSARETASAELCVLWTRQNYDQAMASFAHIVKPGEAS